MDDMIKKFAIESGICYPEALDDPEGYDNYRYYDSLTKFIELTREYFQRDTHNQNDK